MVYPMPNLNRAHVHGNKKCRVLAYRKRFLLVVLDLIVKKPVKVQGLF